MNEQEAFDKVATCISDQGGFSFVMRGATTVCKYRSPDGKKCAAGCLIPDEAYDPEMEDLRIVAEKLEWLFNPGRPLSGLNSNFVSALQAAHDTAAGAGGAPMFVSYMQEIASKYELDSSILEVKFPDDQFPTR